LTKVLGECGLIQGKLFWNLKMHVSAGKR